MTNETWGHVLSELQKTVGKNNFTTWIEPLEFADLTNGVATISVPTTFVGNWVSRNYGDQILRYLSRAGAKVQRVEFVPKANGAGHPVAGEAPKAKRAKAKPADDIELPGAPLDGRFTFDSFVVGKPNALAHAAARRVAEGGPVSFNPLFLYGGVGLGKTHLMHAIAWELQTRRPDLRVVYLSAEQFMYRFIQALRDKDMMAFKTLFRSVDVLMVDDVQFIAGKDSTQEEFFHTFNALFEGHKQIVLTSDRPPKELPGLEDRLISRFEWGMVADIGHPDLEHRIAILRKKAEQDHLEMTIPDDVLRFIAEHVRSSVRELEGCIIKLLLYASLKNREVTIDLAREALSDKIRQGDDSSAYGGRATPSIDRVQEVVARRWGVTPEGLRSKARTKTLTIPRQVAMYLARDMLAMQLVEIGQAFGGRDHSTVIHSVDKVERQMVRDRSFKDRVDLARRELSAL
jgi:chromosomal replication initiator protein